MVVSKHNANGYKNGCRCDICRAAHRKYQRAMRDSQRDADVPERGYTLAQALADPGGPLEMVLERELEFLESDPPFRGTLVELARLNARVIDHAGELGDPKILSNAQIRLANALDRLAKAVQTADRTEFDLAELLRPE